MDTGKNRMVVLQNKGSFEVETTIIDIQYVVLLTTTQSDSSPTIRASPHLVLQVDPLN